MKLIWKSLLIVCTLVLGGFTASSAIAQSQEEIKSTDLFEKSAFDTLPTLTTIEIEQSDLSWETPPVLADNEINPKPVLWESDNYKPQVAENKQPVQENQTPSISPEPIVPEITPENLSDNCLQPIQKTEETPSPEGEQTNSNIVQPTTEETPPEGEEKTSSIPQPTPKELADYEKFAQADRYYRCGEKFVAEGLYKEVKQPFKAEIQLDRQLIPEPIYEPEQLQPGGAVYWRLYQEGLQGKQFESKILAPLRLLTEKNPEFIPGHIYYANALRSFGKGEQAREVLEKGVSLYPNEPTLAMVAIEADQADQRWLEASLTARRFVLFNPDHFRVQEFTQIADENLKRYKSQLNSQLTWNAVGNAILGGVGYAVLGNLGAPLSAIQTTVLLMQGETAVGSSYAESVKKQLPLMQDEEVLNYVRNIGQKIAAVSGRNEFNYEFYVVMDENINAFALPGGKIFVNAGAILKTNSEAELAGLLAHEISHAVLSHGFQLMTQGNLMANVTQFIPYIGSTAGNLIVLNYSRDMERQADIFGTKLLSTSGYAADGVRNLMVILEADKQPSTAAWLSTHPDTSERVQYLEEMIVTYNLNRYAYEGVEKHWQIRERVGQLLDEYNKKKEKEKNL